ncbi:MAG: glycosyltransferase family A protein, partial [Solirubrobacteraceae bacterium]
MAYARKYPLLLVVDRGNGRARRSRTLDIPATARTESCSPKPPAAAHASADGATVKQVLRPQPLTRRPTVSVVIPCYNYGRYLPMAVRSALDQTDVDVEAIVIDDASPDGSARVARDLERDARVRAIVHRTNRGHIFTINEGLEHATGDYVVVLSADDVLTPGSLGRAIALMEARPSVGFVYGFPASFGDEPPRVSGHIRSWTIWTGQEWIRRRCQTGSNCILSPEVVMRASVQRAIGGNDANLPHTHDFDMWLRAAAVSDVGRINGPAQAFYRIHDKSMTRTVHAGHVTDLEGRLAALEKVISDQAGRLGDGEALLANARRALAMSALEFARSAFDHGRGTTEPVNDYLAFAARVCPTLEGTRKWRALSQRAVADPGRLDRGVAASVRRSGGRV